MNKAINETLEALAVLECEAGTDAVVGRLLKVAKGCIEIIEAMEARKGEA
ncbi:MAG TPA: hypothetical protein PLC54_06245 [Spirochaetales bacterium]|nr:hypothetical protein [Spirochaetales bacterium]